MRTYIDERVSFGKNVYLGDNVKIMGEVEIGDSSIIGDNVIIGYPSEDEFKAFRNADVASKEAPRIESSVRGVTRIGKNSVVRTGCIIGSGTTIGNDLNCDHYVQIGSNTSIGRNALIQYRALIYNDVVIGDNAIISGFCCNRAKIGNDVSMLGFLVHSYKQPRRGLTEPSPTISNNATIGMLAIVVGGVTIGEGAYVGAGSVVTRDVDPYTVVVGTRARVARHLKK